MSSETFEVGTRVVYYAEGVPYKGPFPAFIEAVHPPEKGRKVVLPDVDLKVYFSGIEGPTHSKTRVKYAAEPQKHCWGKLPDGWTWPEPAKEAAPEPAPEPAQE